MSEKDRPKRGVHDPILGLIEVPVSDEEWDEIKAKQARAAVMLVEQAEAIATEEVEAERVKTVIDARPKDDEIKNAKTTDLKDLMLKQNAVIDVLLKKLGLLP